jgi:hypothetical protein
MNKLILVSSILALILTGFCLAVGIDIALQGALVTDGIERFPGAMALIPILTLALVLGVGITLLAAILSLVQSARSHQWIWFILMLLLVPLTLFAWFSLAFGNLAPGLLVLVLPLVTLLYSLFGTAAQTNPSSEV